MLQRVIEKCKMGEKVKNLLEVRDLTCSFQTEDGVLRAVDRVSFTIEPGETLGLVGESGCGKTVTALSIMRLVPDPPGKIEGGEVLFLGRDLMALSEKEIRKIRGNDISMIFQEPMTSLNPVLTCGYQIEEAINLHLDLSKKEAEEKTLHMLDLVNIPDPKRCAKSYPHQLSGGMRQRVMIAMALSCNPRLLIADEPTTALDVTIQAQILELLRELQDRLNMAILIITHDLGVIAETANRVVVMYAGQVVEMGDVMDIFHKPRHPYTLGLKASMPRLARKDQRLSVIPGKVPDLIQPATGCRFSDRCKYAEYQCDVGEIAMRELSQEHSVRCWKDIE